MSNSNSQRSAGSLARKSVISFGLKISSAVVQFVFNLVVARYLGAEHAGNFFLALAIVTVLATVARMGLDTTATKTIGASISMNDWGAVNQIYRVSTVSVAAAALFLSLLTYFTSDFIAIAMSKNELRSLLPVFAFVIFAMALTIQHAQLFQGKKNIVAFQVFLQLGSTSVFLILLPFYFLFGRSNNPAESLAYLLLFSYGVMLVVAFVSWAMGVENKEVSHSFPTRQLFVTAMPLWGTAMLDMIQRSLGQLAIGTWSTAEDVAIYSVSLRIAMLVTVVQASVNSIAFPTFAALYRENKTEELRKTAIWSARYATLFCTPVVLLMLVFPGFILQLFGSEFLNGQSALRIMAIGQFFNVATGPVTGLLAMTGHERVVFLGAILSAFLVISLSIMLIPMFGVNGAAVAHAVAISGQMFFLVFCVRKIFGFAPLGFLK